LTRFSNDTQHFGFLRSVAQRSPFFGFERAPFCARLGATRKKDFKEGEADNSGVMLHFNVTLT